MAKRRLQTKKVMVISLGSALVVFLFLYGAVRLFTQTPVGEGGKRFFSPAIVYRSELSGRPVTSTVATRPLVVGIMLDNHPDARPVFGLAAASVVYEAPVEGQFTRYFALFPADDTVEKVGPVRSARPYFLDWLSEYGDALYLHSGGSPEALRLIKSRGIFDANEFFWGSHYWRDRSLSAPHNLFTQSSLWQEIAANYGDRHPVPEWSGWKFGEAPSATSSLVKAISSRYSPYYAVGWRYDEETGKYERTENGQIYYDGEGNKITADTVVVLEMKVRVIDDEGRKEIDTISTSSARVVQRGGLTPGIWKKESWSDRTRVYNESGEEIPFTPGTIWVQVVPVGTLFTVTK